MQDELALLARTACRCMGHVFQLNDLGMNALSPFSWHFECTCTLPGTLHCGGNRKLGGQLMALGPPKPPNLYHQKYP